MQAVSCLHLKMSSPSPRTDVQATTRVCGRRTVHVSLAVAGLAISQVTVSWSMYLILAVADFHLLLAACLAVPALGAVLLRLGLT